MRRRPDRGQSTIELIALLPILLLVGLYALQIGVAMWTMSSTNEAARESARAYSLGQDPETAAELSLPGAMDVYRLDTFEPGHGVQLTVEVPKVAPMPTWRVTREVVMP